MSQFASLLSLAFGIGLLVAGGLAGLMRGRITMLRETADDLRSRLGDLEASDRAKSTELAELRNERDVLRRMVTGEAQLTRLTEMLDHHHEQAMAEWRRLTDVDRRIETAMLALAATIGGTA
ncbi:MAG: hypothetical protein ACRDP1_01880 [Nocardioidaceae bacterium]